MKSHIFVLILFLFTPFAAQANPCTEQFNDSQLQKLLTDKFVIQAAERRNQTAIKLLSCLGEPNPKVRDDIVYAATSEWLRADALSVTTIKSMFDYLTNILHQPDQDALNFTQPFAALVLSEVLRVDRITPYLSNKDRQKAVDVTTSYMRNIEDYRGFDDQQGWRHAVAHTADVFLQLALNKNISKKQLDQLLAAIKSQVSPQSSHFYVYGEPKRLAMPFIYIALRGEHTELKLTNYLKSVANPAPYADWQKVYKDNFGLAKRHNTRSFLNSIFVITADSDNPLLASMHPTLIELIKKLG